MSDFNINQNDYFVYNKAVQDLTEKIRMACTTYAIGTDRKTGDLIYAHSDGTWHNLLDDITKQMMQKVQEKREPVYELYKNLDGKYTLRTVLYNTNQIAEFCSTAGKRIMSVSGKMDMLKRLERDGIIASCWDISSFDVKEILNKYVSEQEKEVMLNENVMKNYWELKNCLDKYIDIQPDIYRWHNLGMNSKGELAYLHGSLGGGRLRCTMGNDGYPDILNDRDESVFDYMEEMDLSEEDIAEIRGMDSYSEEKEL